MEKPINAPRWLINGRPSRLVDVDERGLHYGDGLFETCAVVAGRVPLWERHLGRLQEGCRRLGFPPPPPTRLQEEASRLCAGASLGVLKLILTRGRGTRGYRPPADPAPTRLLGLRPYPLHALRQRSTGVRVRLCRTRLGRQPLLAGIKHLGRLEQVLARAEWQDPGIAEGLMLDTEGDLIEATQANLFLARGGCLRTPDLGCSGVAGVMRGLILDHAADAGLDCRVERCSPSLLRDADELFLTNAVIGIWPVVACEDRAYPIGPVIRGLMRALAAEFPPLAMEDPHE